MPILSEQQLANSLARFREDTAGHVLTIAHDVGPYRHLRFAAPDRGRYWFDLITWPNHLTVAGDFGGAYMFRLSGDLFSFFRGSMVSPDYWSTKLADRDQKVTVYSEDLLRDQVRADVVTAIRNRTAPTGIGKPVHRMILEQDLTDEHRARYLVEQFAFGERWTARCSCGESAEVAGQAAGWAWEFRHRTGAATRHEVKVQCRGFRFENTWEWDCQEYTFRYLWACQAIRWGVEQYDAARVLAEAGVAS